jgi:hypothetical protein
MTVMIGKFFGIPPGIIRLGKVKSLSGAAVKLLMALWHQSERNCTRTLRCTTAGLEELTGCSRNALITARADLVKAGLVQVEPYGVKGFVLHLCDPETRKPWPGDPKHRIIYAKKDVACGPLSSDGERVEKPKLDAAVEPAVLKDHRSEDPSSRVEPMIDKRIDQRPITAPISPPRMSWNVAEQSHPSDEIGLGGTSFPFGYNAPTSSRPGSNPVRETLRVFD